MTGITNNKCSYQRRTRPLLRVEIPEGIDFSRFPRDFHDPIAYFLHLILRKQSENEGGFTEVVALKSEYVRNICGRPYFPSTRHILEDAEIITCDRSCEIGRKCYWYRLLEPYSTDGDTRPYFISTRRIIRAVGKKRAEYKRRETPTDRWLKANLMRLDDIDWGDVERRISCMTAPIAKKKKHQLTTPEYQTIIRRMVGRFSSRLEDYKPDDFGRRHHFITRLPKPLRPYMRIDGERLHEIDIRNSQPLFAGVVLLEKFAKTNGVEVSKWRVPRSRRMSLLTRFSDSDSSIGGKAAGTMRGDIAAHIAHRFQPSTNPSIETETRPLSTTPAVLTEAYSKYAFAEWVPEDLILYITLCENGQFYEYFMPEDDDRDGFKEQIFRDVYYGKDKHPSAIRKRFAAEFPTVFLALKEFKAGKKDDSYKRAAQQMQRVESRLVIDTACRRLMHEHRDQPVLTIHDALAARVQHIPAVEATLRDAFGKYGIKPTFKVKEF